MVTVSALVKHYLEKNPFIKDMLMQGVLNITALAEKIRPHIEFELEKPVKISSISMSIRRAQEDFGKKEMFVWKFPPNLEISTKSKIYEISIEHTKKLPQLLEKIKSAIKTDEGHFLNHIEGLYEIVFFTNQNNKEKLKTILKNEKITWEVNNLSLISIEFPKTTKDTPGIYYQITRALASKSIPIQSYHTIGSELNILIKNKDFTSAHELISSLFENKS